MHVWHMAFDAWNEIENKHGGELTLDQRIAQANTLALLSLGQELSKIHHEGINPEYSARD